MIWLILAGLFVVPLVIGLVMPGRNWLLGWAIVGLVLMALFWWTAIFTAHDNLAAAISTYFLVCAGAGWLLGLGVRGALLARR